MQIINNYECIKLYVRDNLEKVEGSLPHDQISKEIVNTRQLINNLSKDYLKMIFHYDVENLDDNDWILMKRELELEFDVDMGQGMLIQGDEQRKRDTKWWTDREKLKEDYYWSRYKKYMKKKLPPKVIKTIDIDTDEIMNNLENPKLDKFSRYGMVVGHVQSGKTGNYSALICKAADAGYKFIVVIAGGMNNLRNQTQQRLNEGFIGIDKGKPVGVGKYAGTKKSHIPRSLTTSLQDFNKRDADKNSQSTNLDSTKSPVVLVIKKNTSTLENVVGWLTSIYGNRVANHAMLLIDDESDYASINTKKAEEDPTAINRKIRELLGLFEKSAYVAYTATPYANIFIDHKVEDERMGRDLFPKDFIYALDAPDNYFGAKKIFMETNFKHIITIPEPDNLKLSHKKDHKLRRLPDTLKDAIRLFLINIGVRNLKNQGNKHNSMLIHASRFTAVHQEIGAHVEEYLSILRKDIKSYGLLDIPENQSNNIRHIKETFELRCREVQFSWKNVIKSIYSTIDTVVIREVHQEKSIELVYRDDYPTNAIVIGGTSLARGYTLEGLSVSYFLRKTIFYDTLMQMGRWFGYRSEYEELCKIYMTKDMRNNFRDIIEATEELFEDFKTMSRMDKTPYDFGLAVQQHPDSGLQVTARNKQRHTKEIIFEMKLDGHLKETSKITLNEEANKENINLIKELVSEVSKTRENESNLKNNYLWKNVDKSMVAEFIDKFNIYKHLESDIFGIKSRMPLDFIKKYVEGVNTTWDVALYSVGEKENCKIKITDNITIYKQKRKVEISDNKEYYEVGNRQVSSGNAESISLSDKECKGIKRTDRKAVRDRLKRPLLMLHILDVNENDEKMMEVAAFGISFPGGITSTGKTVKLKINSVYIEKLLNGEEYDD